MPAIQRLLGMTQRALSRVPGAALTAAKVRNQCNMIIGTAMSTGTTLEASGELWLADLVAPSAKFFVDVGANVGEWAIAFANRMGPGASGLLLEPNPQTAERLRSRLIAEGLAGCEVLMAAAGDTEGRMPFFAEEYFGETSSFYQRSLRLDAKTIDVEVVRLDDILNVRGIRHVDMLKIDAEGNDFRVMEGVREHIAGQAIDVIQFEYNQPWLDAGSTLTHAFEFLKNSGYTTQLLNRRGLSEFNIEQIGDYFNYSNFVAYRSTGLREDLGAALRSRKGHSQ